MPDNRVIFEPNTPQEIAFKSEGVFENGRYGDTVRFRPGELSDEELDRRASDWLRASGV